MTYELWDHDSRNLIGVYATEAAALRVVREVIRDHGRSSNAVTTLMLGYHDGAGGGGMIALGTELADRALAGLRPTQASAS